MAPLELRQKVYASLLREIIGSSAQRLMGLGTKPLCGAARGERGADRLDQRNGYQERDGETRAGTVSWGSPSSVAAATYQPSPNLSGQPRRR